MQKIFLHNTLTKKKEEFKPIKEGEVGIYSCGPTVYNFVHIGNLRSYIFADTLHRVLAYNGYKVKHVMNITDVDDKTIRDSQAAGISLKDFTDKYTASFFEDLEKININKDEYIFPRATENIQGMVALIKKLLDKGFAYKAEDGSIYFAISKFKDYGKLSGVDFERDSKSRVDNDEYAKEEAHDFALWKAWDEKDGDVFWETELGKGRPGWHIECSVMSSANLGETFDIHTGGIDLIFPHHENEIAQSEAANDKKFVNYWLHNEMLMVDSQKMSKSLNNVYTLQDIINKGFNPMAFRYLCLQTHYKQKQNFTWEALKFAANTIESLVDILVIAKDQSKGKPKGSILKDYQEKFLEKINEDLNLSGALSIIFELLETESAGLISIPDMLETIFDFDKVLGLQIKEFVEKKSMVPEEAKKDAEERKRAKETNNYSKSDELRTKIQKQGVKIIDVQNNNYILSSSTAVFYNPNNDARK
ncbi:MAG: cysteine--tRNA ligase [Patescibacteria group bacterium]|nr:cysteine--tRNA ligase [Patescibacteria group bacterium]